MIEPSKLKYYNFIFSFAVCPFLTLFLLAYYSYGVFFGERILEQSIFKFLVKC